MVNLVTFTSLYPNRVQPLHGIFVETRLRKILDQTGAMTCVVIAPVPWFPIRNSFFQNYSKFAQVPRKEERFGITIYHPRYLVIPKIGMLLTPFFMFFGVMRTFHNVIKKYQSNVIDAHYFYPDGVTAVLLGKFFKLPVVITARGSDVNLIPNYSIPRKLICWAAQKSSQIIAVSKALSLALQSLGVNKNKIRILRNGVNLHFFSPTADRASLRKLLNFNGDVILSVGNLVPLKGHDLIIRSMMSFPDKTLIIIGKGPEESLLKKLAMKLNVSQRVIFIGEVSQQQLVNYYCAVDVLVLASSREGMPNVVLEAIACGTPVVATDVGGVKEIISNNIIGILVGQRSVEGITHAIEKIFNNYPSREEVRRHATCFAWEEIALAQADLYKMVCQLSNI